MGKARQLDTVNLNVVTGVRAELSFTVSMLKFTMLNFTVSG